MVDRKMSRKQLRFAIVGCGSIGGSAALICRANRRIKAVMACDRDVARAAGFAGRHGIAGYSGDFGEILIKGGFDAVYLAVPHHLHHEMITAALDAGLPVLAEKPVTRTLAEGRAVAEKAALLGLKLGVNYQHRYNPGCYALASAVRDGKIGAVHSARINIPWHREISYFDNAPWHARKETAGGGTLITQGSHFLDIVLWAMNEQPTGVRHGLFDSAAILHLERQEWRSGCQNRCGGSVSGNCGDGERRPGSDQQLHGGQTPAGRFHRSLRGERHRDLTVATRFLMPFSEACGCRQPPRRYGHFIPCRPVLKDSGAGLLTTYHISSLPKAPSKPWR